jgi:microtubule-associated protein 1 light chain
MPKVFTVGEVLTIIRKKLSMEPSEGLILLANGKQLLKNDMPIQTVFHKYQDQDGFLYLTYELENIYG